MKFSMTGQEKSDLLIEVTAWAGLTVHTIIQKYILNSSRYILLNCLKYILTS